MERELKDMYDQVSTIVYENAKRLHDKVSDHVRGPRYKDVYCQIACELVCGHNLAISGLDGVP